MPNNNIPKFEDTAPLYEDSVPLIEDISVGEDAPSINQDESARAMLQGAEQGLTFGFADELGGALGAGLEASKFSPDLNESKTDQLSRLYKEYRDLNRSRYKQLEEQYPVESFAGNIAGGIVNPLATVGNLGKSSTILQKVQAGAKAGLGFGALAGAGVSESSPIEQPKEFTGDVLSGAEYGALFGAGIPAIQGVATETTAGAKKAFDYLSQPFKAGYKYGRQGELLSGEAAESAAKNDILKFGKQLPKQFESELNNLAEQRNSIIKNAKDAGVEIDTTKIDNFINDSIANNSLDKTNKAEVLAEVERLKEILATAKEGKQVEKVSEVFVPKEDKTPIGQFKDKLEKHKITYQTKQSNPDLAIKSELSPKEKFAQEFDKYRAEQRAIPGQHNPTEPELIFEPINETTELGVIRQAQFDDMGNFAGFKKIKSKEIPTNWQPTIEGEPEMVMLPSEVPNKVYGVIRQPIKQGDKIVDYKILERPQLLDKDTFADTKMITETVREGGRNIRDPREFQQLLEDLKNSRFQSPEVTQMSQNLTKQGRAILDETLPEVKALNQEISLRKKAANISGITETKNLSDELTEKNMMKNVESFVNELASGKTENFNTFINTVKQYNPALAEQLSNKINTLAEKAKLTKGKELFGFYVPRPLATPVGTLEFAGNISGLSVNKLMKDIPELDRLIQKFRQMKSTVGQTKTGQMLADELQRAKEITSEKARGAALFSIMQQPQYRQLLENSQQKADAK